MNRLLSQLESGLRAIPCFFYPAAREKDLSLALDLIADDRLVMGNLDPRLFINNSPEEIERLTGDLMDKYAAHDNWRPSTGCDLSPDASLELIMTFIQRAAAA